MDKLEQFFYENAGYSWDRATETQEEGHMRCAKALADAARAALENGWHCTWRFDEYQYDDAGEATATYYCNLHDADGTILASCGGIDTDNGPYARIIAAELALEVICGNY